MNYDHVLAEEYKFVIRTNEAVELEEAITACMRGDLFFTHKSIFTPSRHFISSTTRIYSCGALRSSMRITGGGFRAKDVVEELMLLERVAQYPKKTPEQTTYTKGWEVRKGWIHGCSAAWVQAVWVPE